MSEHLQRTRIETQTIIVGYAMSRLDDAYLLSRGRLTWKAAYAEAAQVLSVPPASLNNLRDEFDPFHDNPRKGWRNRPLYPSRERVLLELADMSDDALIELVTRILTRDDSAIAEAVDSLAVDTKIAHNVAERLLTGRRAEEYFRAHCREIVGTAPEDLLDRRSDACGYDFGMRDAPGRAFEVKGLKATRGGILFTDREWREAKTRQSDYCLIVVGNLSSEPKPKVIYNPSAYLPANCVYSTVISSNWQARVDVSE